MIAGIVASGLYVPSGPPLPPHPPGIAVGDPYAGGYYVGRINYGTPGENYWLVVGPASDDIAAAVRTSNTAIAGSISRSNGLANTALMIGTTFPAAQHCRTRTTGGFSDWYFGAMDEVEMLCRYLRPTANAPYQGVAPASVGGGMFGDNPSSIPEGIPNTPTNPGQTSVEIFKSGNAQALITNGAYRTSSLDMVSAARNESIHVSAGNSFKAVYTISYAGYRVRPFRRVLIPN